MGLWFSTAVTFVQLPEKETHSLYLVKLPNTSKRYVSVFFYRLVTCNLVLGYVPYSLKYFKNVFIRQSNVIFMHL